MFSIGLNIGLHGMIDLQSFSGTSGSVLTTYNSNLDLISLASKELKALETALGQEGSDFSHMSSKLSVPLKPTVNLPIEQHTTPLPPKEHVPAYNNGHNEPPMKKTSVTVPPSKSQIQIAAQKTVEMSKSQQLTRRQTTPTRPSPPSSTSTSEVAKTSAVMDTEGSTSLSAREAMDSVLYSGEYTTELLNAQVKTTDQIRDRDDISRYVSGGHKIPVVILTCNRATLLKETLASLFRVRGIQKKNILVIQDGKDEGVMNVVKEHGLDLDQDLPSSRNSLRGHMNDGAARIATHYKYSLTKAFDVFKNAPAIIIVEDDLLFAPDFLEYFEHVSPILDVDESAFLISAWNDNGYTGKVDDPYALQRTEFFPGLGWLLPRKLYKNELELQWPRVHWDHWLRSMPIHKGREIIYPQVPRTYHNGVRGTFMDQSTHNKYFKDIAVNQNTAVTWIQNKRKAISISNENKASKSIVSSSRDIVGMMPAYWSVYGPVYEKRLQLLITHCHHVQAAEEIADPSLGPIMCIWLKVNPESTYGQPEFQPIATFFKIWHEHSRGVHHGVHEFYWEGKYVLLLNTFVSQSKAGNHNPQALARTQSAPSTYVGLKPHGVPFIQANTFAKSGVIMAKKNSLKRKSVALQNSLQFVAASRVDQSCVSVCEEKGLLCNANYLDLANSCDVLQQHFGCSGCDQSIGNEQPSYIDPSSPVGQGKGRTCLITTAPERSTCEAKHKYTMRLCTCLPH